MGSQWSHSFVVIDQSHDTTYLCETTDLEVSIGRLEAYIQDPNTTLELWACDLTDDQRMTMRKIALQKYGTVYGYFQLLSLGIRRLLMRIGIRIPNFIQEGYVCDQVPLDSCIKAGIPYFNGKNAKAYDTQEFYEMMQPSGFVRTFRKEKGTVYDSIADVSGNPVL